MPRVTVTLGSSRPGGLDVSLAGLCRQTFEDFEVVFVDGRYHERHARVLEAVRRSGLRQPFFHVPNHRSSGTVWGTTCAGYNTGFMLASGEIVVMLLDYAYAPPTWLEEHVRHHANMDKLVMAPHEYRKLSGVKVSGIEPLVEEFSTYRKDHPMSDQAFIEVILAQRARFDEVSAFDPPWTPEMLEATPLEGWQETKIRMWTGPCRYSYFNTKNESFPRKNIMVAGGMDEHYDRGGGPGDPDLSLRLTRTGLEGWVAREAVVHCLNPRSYMPNINIVLQARKPEPPYDYRMSYEEGVRYFVVNTAGRDDAVVAPNPFDLAKKSEEIWHWRDLSQLPDPVIPKNVVSDADYFKDGA